MFNLFLGLVSGPQLVIDAVDLVTVFGELDDFTSEDLQECLEDMFLFHSDQLIGEGQ